MRAVVTRVNEASVTIDGEVTGKIGRGFLILLGITQDDTPAICRKLAEKVLGLRIFTDENYKMNQGLSAGLDAAGGFLRRSLTAQHGRTFGQKDVHNRLIPVAQDTAGLGGGDIGFHIRRRNRYRCGRCSGTVRLRCGAGRQKRGA